MPVIRLCDECKREIKDSESRTLIIFKSGEGSTGYHTTVCGDECGITYLQRQLDKVKEYQAKRKGFIGGLFS